MKKRILITTSSFLETQGPHREMLNKSGYEVVPARGPLSEGQLLEILKNDRQPDQEKSGFDAVLCGEDEFTKEVIQNLAPRVKVISKYGVGLEKIDLEAAKQCGIAVKNTPRVNHTTVSELTFGLLIALTRKIVEHNLSVHAAKWERRTGVELAGKTFGIIGLGRVGKEVAKRALAFGMNVAVYNTNWSASHEQFVKSLNRIYSDLAQIEGAGEESSTLSVKQVELDTLLKDSHVISLHINISKENRAFLDRYKINLCRHGAYILNLSRGGLVDAQAMTEAIRKGRIAGYGADVLEPEPVSPDNPLLGVNNVLLTPHIASRTFESVARQGQAALENVISVIGAAAS
jgi:D-3-phosphoglycerate dehydrogenase